MEGVYSPTPIRLGSDSESFLPSSGRFWLYYISHPHWIRPLGCGAGIVLRV